MKHLLLIFLSYFLSNQSWACSFIPGYAEPRISSVNTVNAAPYKPLVSISSIVRGRDDGNHGSCSDAGMIVLKFEDENSPSKTAYKLKVTDSDLFSDIFPSYPITFSSDGMRNREMFFVWYDLGKTKNKALVFTLEVIAVSHSGKESESFELKINMKPAQSG